MPKSNVHPDHYKTAGRERQGEDVVQELQKKTLSQTQAEYERFKPCQSKSVSSPTTTKVKASRREPSSGRQDRRPRQRQTSKRTRRG